MNDAAFERRLNDWFADREPGPVPASLRDAAARVPLETPVPVATRVWQTIVGPGRTSRRGSALRLAFVLAVIGLLIAAVASLWVAGSRQPPITAWRDYAVGHPAPDVDFGSATGTISSGDSSISVDDIPEAMFVMYFPGDAVADQVTADASTLIAAMEHAPARTAFLVIPSRAAPLAAETAKRVHDAGMLTADPPADWPASQGAPVLIVTDHHGNVAYVYVGAFPAADWLVGDLDRASIQ